MTNSLRITACHVEDKIGTIFLKQEDSSLIILNYSLRFPHLKHWETSLTESSLGEIVVLQDFSKIESRELRKKFQAMIFMINIFEHFFITFAIETQSTVGPIKITCLKIHRRSLESIHCCVGICNTQWTKSSIFFFQCSVGIRAGRGIRMHIALI